MRGEPPRSKQTQVGPGSRTRRLCQSGRVCFPGRTRISNARNMLKQRELEGVPYSGAYIGLNGWVSLPRFDGFWLRL